MNDDESDTSMFDQLFGGFTTTWDHDFIHLWCPDCPDSERAVEVFSGNPTDLVEVVNAAVAHRAVMHGGSPA